MTPLIFLHLPKTAGTTLGSILRRHVDPGADYLLRSAEGPHAVAAFKALPAETRHQIQLLRGHQVFGLHEYLAPGARYLTVVREPVARIVSHYDFVKRTKHPMFIREIESGHMSLLDYATSGISGELENGQTRWLAGIDDDRPLTREHLDQALQNIDAYFAWVGVQERFDESIVELGLKMRWVRVDYRRRNVGAGADSVSLDAGVEQAIRERNPLDVELHALLTERLDSRGHLIKALRKLGATAVARAHG